MGRKGSILVPFLVEGLQKKKYGQYLTGSIDNIIQIILPRKTKNLCCDSMKILKDWNLKKGRQFKNQNDYTKAKQGMLAALRRSDYLERVLGSKPKLCYKILNRDEVKEKKQKLKGKKKSINELQPPSSVESGFHSSVESPMTDLSYEMDDEYVLEHDIFDSDSGVDSPSLNESQFCDEVATSESQSISASGDCLNNSNILNAIKHDHDAYFSNVVLNQEAAILSIDQIPSDLDKLNFNQLKSLELKDSEYEELLGQISFDESTFSDIHIMDENDVTTQVYTARVLKLHSENFLGETSFLACEPEGTDILINKSGASRDIFLPCGELFPADLDLVLAGNNVSDAEWDSMVKDLMPPLGLPVGRENGKDGETDKKSGKYYKLIEEKFLGETVLLTLKQMGEVPLNAASDLLSFYFCHELQWYKLFEFHPNIYGYLEINVHQRIQALQNTEFKEMGDHLLVFLHPWQTNAPKKFFPDTDGLN